MRGLTPRGETFSAFTLVAGLFFEAWSAMVMLGVGVYDTERRVDAIVLNGLSFRADTLPALRFDCKSKLLAYV